MRKIVVAFLVGFVLMAVCMAGSVQQAKAGPNDAWWKSTYTQYVLIVGWGWAGNTTCQGLGQVVYWPPNYYPRYQWWYCQDAYRSAYVQTTGDTLTRSGYLY